MIEAMNAKVALLEREVVAIKMNLCATSKRINRVNEIDSGALNG